jgi:uncharacterized damage-inducible protein DinB
MTTIPLKEFDAEMASTRKLLERVPSDKAQWKPHEKSFPLGHLALLVSWMPGWIADSLEQSFKDLKPGSGGGYTFETTETILGIFDKNVTRARATLQSVTGAALEENWSLKVNGNPVWTAPRWEVIRAHLNHLIHHRGQLTVYLRLVNVPLPQVYGPTADERW